MDQTHECFKICGGDAGSSVPHQPNCPKRGDSRNLPMKEWDELQETAHQPALQDEARATWYKQSNELRAIARNDFETWEQEQLAWWDKGCR